jgi:hypothetical protein
LAQKASKKLKRPANGRSASQSFLSTNSKRCEEFRSGQEKQIAGFESAAYVNFRTPVAFRIKDVWLSRDSERVKVREKVRESLAVTLRASLHPSPL